MFDTEPIAERRKGWTPRPQGGVKLVRSWQPPEQVGAGQGIGGGEEFSGGSRQPPMRDDWRLPEAPSGLDNPSPTGYSDGAAQSTPLPTPSPAGGPPTRDVSGGVGAPASPRVPPSKPAGGVGSPPQPQEWPQIQTPGSSSGHLSTNNIIDVASQAIGSKYIWGGPGGRTSFDPKFVGSDCSGFTAWAYYNATGIKLPAFTGSIYQSTKSISRSDARPGDIVMWGMQNSGAADQHVGIYAGGNMWIHDSSVNPNGGVQLTPLWSNVEFRRVPGVDTSAAPQKMIDAPQPTNPANVWAGMNDQAETNPADVWQADWGHSTDQAKDISPADVWKSLGAGADYDAGDGSTQEENPWANQLLDPATDIPVSPPTSNQPQSPSYPAVSPWERHAAETQAGTPSDELTNPRRNLTPATPAVKPEPQQEPQPTIFDVPILKDPANAVKPIQMARPDTGRPLDPHKFQGQEGAIDFGLPDQPDPNADLSPIARSSAGAPVNPLEMHQQLQDVATQAVVPQQVRDAPLVGGLIEQALDPAWAAGGIGSAGSSLAMNAGGKVIKAIGGNLIAKAPYAVRLADASMGYIAKTGADAILRGLDRIEPGLGRQVAAQLPAQVSARFAASLGSGVAGGEVMNLATDENDPNRIPKILGAAGVGAAAPFAYIGVYPRAVKAFNDIFASARNLPSHAQAMVAQFAHAQESGRVYGDMSEQRILEILADKRGWGRGILSGDVAGFPQKGTGLDAWTSGDLFERTKQLVINPTPAQQALADDMWHYGEMTLKEGKRLGFIRGDVRTRSGVEAYFPHLYEESWGKQSAAATKRGLNPHDFFTDPREHDTLSDGLAAGLHPINSVAEAWGAYVRHYESSKAKRQFALSLRKAGPSVIRRTSGKRPAAPDEWVSGANFSIPGLEQFHVSPDMAKVLKNIENPSSLRNAPIVGGVMSGLAEAKRALFAPSAFHLVHELHQVLNANGQAGVPIFGQALHYNINPWAYRKFMLANADRYVAAANAGVTMMRHHAEAPDIGGFGIQNTLGAAGVRAGWAGGTTGGAAYLQSKSSLEDDQTAIEKGLRAGAAGAMLGIIGGPLSRGLWERSVPTMKLLTWETTRLRYGDKAAAEYVNEVFGGQNLEAIARSKTVQDVLRLGALAPDWQEGWIRQVGNGLRGLAATPYAGQAGKQAGPLQRANADYWTNAALTGAFYLEGLNLALNGHFTNENSDGHQLALELTGLYDKMGWKHIDDKGRPYRVYADILGPYRGLIEAPFDPGKFVKARMGLGPSALEEIFTGKDFTGRDIVPPGEDPLKNAALRVGHALTRLAPVSGTALVQSFGKEPTPVAAASAVTGYRLSRVSPIAEQLRARDKALQQVGLSPERIRQANETYTNLLGQADRDFQAAIGRKNLTHQQIDNELAKIKHPDRADIMAATLPTNLAGDPAKEQELRNTLQKFAGFGTASSQYPADIQPENQVDPQAVSARYWTPRPGIDKLPKPQADSIRAKELASMADEYQVEPNALMDSIKAQSRGIEAKPVPGVSSAAIDEWVKRWSQQADADPMVQSAQRRQAVDAIANEYHLDADTVWNRIKLRWLPPSKPGEMEISRDKALDMLFAAHDPQRFPKYMDQTGKPMGGAQQWQSFDAQVAGAKTARDRSKPEVKALIEARDKATANQRKYILNNPDYQEYQRWFGIGRGMNEAQWAKYVKGDYPHYKDTSDPEETLNRDKIAEQWKASTTAERRLQQVRIMIEGKPETVSLEAARRHLQFELKTGWSKAIGLDTTGTADPSSGG